MCGSGCLTRHLYRSLALITVVCWIVCTTTVASTTRSYSVRRLPLAVTMATAPTPKQEFSPTLDPTSRLSSDQLVRGLPRRETDDQLRPALSVVNAVAGEPPVPPVVRPDFSTTVAGSRHGRSTRDSSGLSQPVFNDERKGSWANRATPTDGKKNGSHRPRNLSLRRVSSSSEPNLDNLLKELLIVATSRFNNNSVDNEITQRKQFDDNILQVIDSGHKTSYIVYPKSISTNSHDTSTADDFETKDSPQVFQTINSKVEHFSSDVPKLVTVRGQIMKWSTPSTVSMEEVTTETPQIVLPPKRHFSVPSKSKHFNRKFLKNNFNLQSSSQSDRNIVSNNDQTVFALPTQQPSLKLESNFSPKVTERDRVVSISDFAAKARVSDPEPSLDDTSDQKTTVAPPIADNSTGVETFPQPKRVSRLEDSEQSIDNSIEKTTGSSSGENVEGLLNITTSTPDYQSEINTNNSASKNITLSFSGSQPNSSTVTEQVNKVALSLSASSTERSTMNDVSPGSNGTKTAVKLSKNPFSILSSLFSPKKPSIVENNPSTSESKKENYSQVLDNSSTSGSDLSLGDILVPLLSTYQRFKRLLLSDQLIRRPTLLRKPDSSSSDFDRDNIGSKISIEKVANDVADDISNAANKVQIIEIDASPPNMKNNEGNIAADRVHSAVQSKPLLFHQGQLPGMVIASPFDTLYRLQNNYRPVVIPQDLLADVTEKVLTDLSNDHSLDSEPVYFAPYDDVEYDYYDSIDDGTHVSDLFNSFSFGSSEQVKTHPENSLNSNGITFHVEDPDNRLIENRNKSELATISFSENLPDATNDSDALNKRVSLNNVPLDGISNYVEPDFGFVESDSHLIDAKNPESSDNFHYHFPGNALEVDIANKIKAVDSFGEVEVDTEIDENVYPYEYRRTSLYNKEQQDTSSSSIGVSDDLSISSDPHVFKNSANVPLSTPHPVFRLIQPVVRSPSFHFGRPPSINDYDDIIVAPHALPDRREVVVSQNLATSNGANYGDSSYDLESLGALVSSLVTNPVFPQSNDIGDSFRNRMGQAGEVSPVSSTVTEKHPTVVPVSQITDDNTSTLSTVVYTDSEVPAATSTPVPDSTTIDDESIKNEIITSSYDEGFMLVGIGNNSFSLDVSFYGNETATDVASSEIANIVVGSTCGLSLLCVLLVFALVKYRDSFSSCSFFSRIFRYEYIRSLGSRMSSSRSQQAPDGKATSDNQTHTLGAWFNGRSNVMATEKFPSSMALPVGHKPEGGPALKPKPHGYNVRSGSSASGAALCSSSNTSSGSLTDCSEFEDTPETRRSLKDDHSTQETTTRAIFMGKGKSWLHSSYLFGETRKVLSRTEGHVQGISYRPNSADEVQHNVVTASSVPSTKVKSLIDSIESETAKNSNKNLTSFADNKYSKRNDHRPADKLEVDHSIDKLHSKSDDFDECSGNLDCITFDVKDHTRTIADPQHILRVESVPAAATMSIKSATSSVSSSGLRHGSAAPRRHRRTVTSDAIGAAAAAARASFGRGAVHTRVAAKGPSDDAQETSAPAPNPEERDERLI